MTANSSSRMDRPDTATVRLHAEARRFETDQPIIQARKLRELAAWYREFAERAESIVIWEARLRTAEDLDAEAERLYGALALAHDPEVKRSHRE